MERDQSRVLSERAAHETSQIDGRNGGAGRASPAPVFLSLVDLTRYYDAVAAVRALSLDVREGEYITLLGPSGCGKTTTLRMIGGFIPPSGGKILLDGADMAALPPERRPVNTVFQDYALFPHLTVEQNVEYGLHVRGIPRPARRARVAEMLERVQIAEFARRYPRYLSGGQQQRVALARALVCQPRLLLLDEPLGALDARLREQMQIVLKDLQRDLKIAFIHVTHDQAEAMALADRIVVMRAGVIEQVGPPEALYHRPANAFVADFLGTTNLFEGRCIRQDGQLVTLEACGMVMQGQGDAAFAPGEPLSASVRPATIHLNEAANGQENGYLGDVEGVIYRGEHWLVRIRVPETQVIALRPASVGHDAGLHVGQVVHFSWRASDCWLMKKG
ncbi:MAG: ABC transporter ATP-binding protein [Anaerolineae bacterium]|nr:ABC transporter ATP-binding protein [Anaerolineae bacterium]